MMSCTSEKLQGMTKVLPESFGTESLLLRRERESGATCKISNRK